MCLPACMRAWGHFPPPELRQELVRSSSQTFSPAPHAVQRSEARSGASLCPVLAQTLGLQAVLSHKPLVFSSTVCDSSHCLFPCVLTSRLQPPRLLSLPLEVSGEPPELHPFQVASPTRPPCAFQPSAAVTPAQRKGHVCREDPGNDVYRERYFAPTAVSP